MKNFSMWLQRLVFAVLSVFVLNTQASAALPLSENGEVVYSIAPMLKKVCLLYTSPSPRDRQKSRMPSSA